MIRIQRLERIAYRLALLLILIAAARFGWVLSHQQWRQPNAEKPTVIVRGQNELPSVTDLQRQLSLASPGAIESAIAAAVGSSPPATAA